MTVEAVVWIVLAVLVWFQGHEIAALRSRMRSLETNLKKAGTAAEKLLKRVDA